MSADVVISKGGRQSHALSEQELVNFELPPPLFETSIEEVTDEVRTQVGHVTIPKTLTKPHRAIGRLLEGDEERKRKMAEDPFPFSWHRPKFDTHFERRRLRFINGLFIALHKYGATPTARNKEGRSFSVRVNQYGVTFLVDDANGDFREYQYHPYGYEPPRNPSHRIKLVIPRFSDDGGDAAWRIQHPRRLKHTQQTLLSS